MLNIMTKDDYIHLEALTDRTLNSDITQKEIAVIVNERMPILIKRLVLPKHERVLTLNRFIGQYIICAPKQLDLVSLVAQNFKNSTSLLTAIKIAYDYCFDALKNKKEVHALELISNTYFCHRTIEEITDRFFIEPSNIALMDMMQANIIIHTVLGEAYANELDSAVLSCIAQCITHHPSSLKHSEEQKLHPLASHYTPTPISDQPRTCLAASFCLGVKGLSIVDP